MECPIYTQSRANFADLVLHPGHARSFKSSSLIRMNVPYILSGFSLLLQENMSYSLNSFKGGLYRGVLQNKLRGILGVQTIAHIVQEALG